MKNRLEWVDSAKAIGMILVFYGHYIELVSLIDENSTIAFLQFKFIYSFHMPFFFVLSGFFAKKRQNRNQHLKKLFLTRIIPVFSFALVFIPLWFIYFGLKNGDIMIVNVITRILSYIGGNPQLNILTWFLICLFAAEFLATIFGMPLKSKWKNLFLGIFFLLTGYYIIEYINEIIHFTKIEKNFWYIHEGIIALGFYLIGSWLYPIISSIKARMYWVFYIIIPLSILLLIIFNNNSFTGEYVISMALSKHGRLIPFLVNSISGSLLIISLAIIIPSNKIFSFIGKNTLLLLGLNGIFLHFLNQYFVRFESYWWSITLYGFVVSMLSILICYPIIILINKYLPQLFGKPFENGPFLKSLDNYSIHRIFDAVQKKMHKLYIKK